MKKNQTKRSREIFEIKVDQHIQLDSPVWSFGLEGLAAEFDDHIKRSIPAYKETQDLIIDLSDYYTRRGGIIFDLGCSTGENGRRRRGPHAESFRTTRMRPSHA